MKKHVLLTLFALGLSAPGLSFAGEMPPLDGDDIELFGDLQDGKSGVLDSIQVDQKARAIEEARRISCQGGRRVFAYEFQGVLETESCKVEKSVCYSDGKLYLEGSKWKCESKKTCQCNHRGDIVIKP